MSVSSDYVLSKELFRYTADIPANGDSGPTRWFRAPRVPGVIVPQAFVLVHSVITGGGSIVLEAQLGLDGVNPVTGVGTAEWYTIVGTSTGFNFNPVNAYAPYMRFRARNTSGVSPAQGTSLVVIGPDSA